MRISRGTAYKKLQKLEHLVLNKLKVKNSALELFLVSNSEMEGVRRELRMRPDFKGLEAQKIRQEESVSILSFPESMYFPHPERRGKMLGEIYLNYDFAKGETDLMSYLFIHGLLHLLGYEHTKNRDRMEMEKLEKELFIYAASRA